MGSRPGTLPLRVRPSTRIWRTFANHLATAAAIGSTILVVTPLVAIFVYLIYKGASSLNFAFFTQIPKPVGETGGRNGQLHHRIGCLLGLASLMGVPIGIASGIYHCGVWPRHPSGRHGSLYRGCAQRRAFDRHGHRSLLADRSSPEALLRPCRRSGLGHHDDSHHHPHHRRDAPHGSLQVREAALGLGVPNWRSVLSITLRTASPGVITGCMLAFARVAGETAPLLFTAFGNQFWSTNINEPIAALPLQIFIYAISPYDEWHRLAWAGALVLIVLIVVSSPRPLCRRTRSFEWPRLYFL